MKVSFKTLHSTFTTYFFIPFLCYCRKKSATSSIGTKKEKRYFHDSFSYTIIKHLSLHCPTNLRFPIGMKPLKIKFFKTGFWIRTIYETIINLCCMCLNQNRILFIRKQVLIGLLKVIGIQKKEQINSMINLYF